MIPAFLASFLWAASTVYSSRAAHQAGGTAAHFFRLVFAVIALSAYAFGFGQGVQGAGFFLFLLSGAVGIGLGDFSAFHAYIRLGPRLTSLLVQCLAAPFGAALEWFWLGTTLSAPQVVGAGIILTGSTLALTQGVSVPGAGSEGAQRKPGLNRRLIAGALMAVGAAFAQAAGAVMTRGGFERSRADGVLVDGMTAAFQRVSGGLLIMLVLYGLIRLLARQSEAPSARERGSLRRALPTIILSSLFGMVFGMGCFQWALETSPTAIVLSITALTPLIVILMAWVLNGDRPTPFSIFSCALAVGGVLILLLF